MSCTPHKTIGGQVTTKTLTQKRVFGVGLKG